MSLLHLFYSYNSKLNSVFFDFGHFPFFIKPLCRYDAFLAINDYFN